ncbi:uncharacterized protein LOC143284006 isoform X1 [Babylonia areolata]|uniref:uncharacterized protein LOC143284006 isoform X1 n=1 Tax=Babylonia areolata TaxID=304850 RepID=UPI003FD52278
MAEGSRPTLDLTIVMFDSSSAREKTGKTPRKNKAESSDADNKSNTDTPKSKTPKTPKKKKDEDEAEGANNKLNTDTPKLEAPETPKKGKDETTDGDNKSNTDSDTPNTPTPQAATPNTATPKSATPKRIVDQGKRREIVTDVLNKLKQENTPNLFVLMQNEITGPLRAEITEQCIPLQEPDYTKVGYNKEAEIYNFSAFPSYDMKYLDKSSLKQVYTLMQSDHDTPDVLHRLRACTITELSTNAKTLLVSWHGPYNIDDGQKIGYFRTLIHLLEGVKWREKCSTVIAGGNFNLFDRILQQILEKETGTIGEVHYNYDLPPGRARNPDQIVCWPAKKLFGEKGYPQLIQPEKVDGEDPFRHPIIKFRFAWEDRTETELTLLKDIKREVAQLKVQQEAYQQDMEEKDQEIKELRELVAQMETR